MARDYKHQVRRKPRRKPAPPWVWMLAGLGIGLFVALLIYLKAGPDDAPVARVVEAPPMEREARGVKKEPPAPIPPPPRPRFDFYTTLPEMEVVVPEDEITGSRKEGVRQVDKPGTYLLQAGSFRTHEQADRLKAQLALLGLETGIQTVSINDRETWHRVRVGPFRDLNELHKIRVQLKSHKVDAILIRVRE
ncbi:MAG: SPOR domain-containing protein [Xanthomonadaceae bacterium]|nr:SPOR domain-containing protein [Xanthomonadaceae bacterium]